MIHMLDFEDFILEGGWDLLFSGICECPVCGYLVQENEEIEWVDKNNKIFKCPGCNENVAIQG